MKLNRQTLWIWGWETSGTGLKPHLLVWVQINEIFSIAQFNMNANAKIFGKAIIRKVEERHTCMLWVDFGFHVFEFNSLWRYCFQHFSFFKNFIQILKLGKLLTIAWVEKYSFEAFTLTLILSIMKWKNIDGLHLGINIGFVFFN